MHAGFRVRAWELQTPRENPTKELQAEVHAGFRVRAWELQTPRENPTKELQAEVHAGLGLGLGSYGHQGKTQQKSFKRRAANPSVDLSVAKSDFKRSNLILSVAYMVLHQDFLKTCCLASPAAERVMLCKTTTKCEKFPHSNYVQML